MTVLVTVLVVLAAVGGFSVFSYNRFLRQQQEVTDAWRVVEVELRFRADLAGTVGAILAGHAAHERAVVEETLKARKRVLEPDSGAATAVEKAAASDVEMSMALSRLMQVASGYQRVNADPRFIDAREQLKATEERLSAARRRYNTCVRAYNTRLARMPAALTAVGTSYRPARYFEVLDPAVRAAVPVRFDIPAPVVPASEAGPSELRSSDAASAERKRSARPDQGPVA